MSFGVDASQDLGMSDTVTMIAQVDADISVDLNQSTAAVPLRQGWQTGLFDCDCQDDGCRTCCCAICCPCAAFASVASIVDQGSDGRCVYGCFYMGSAIFGMSWLYTAWYRRKLRGRFGLPEAPLPDRYTHLLCHVCAIAQEYRELAKRDFDVRKGWQGRPRPPAVAPAATALPKVQAPMARS